MVTGNFLGGPTTGAVTIITVFLLGDGPWVRLLPFLVNFLSTDVQFPLYSIGWKYRFNMYSILLCNVKYIKKKMTLTRPNLHTHKYPDHAIERTELATLMASLESHMGMLTIPNYWCSIQCLPHQIMQSIWLRQFFACSPHLSFTHHVINVH